MSAKVSIIVPVYNAERYLKKCVRSLLKQSLSDIRIILINDGSTDHSGKICDNFARLDARVQVIHKANEGTINARNTGIQTLPEQGYTTFCDADDYMPANAVEKLYQLAITQQADIACGIVQRFWSKGFLRKEPIPPSLQTPRTYDKIGIQNELLHSYFGVTDFPGYMPTKLYKNKYLKQSVTFERPVRFFQEDIAFNAQMLLLAERIAVIPDVVYFYRMGGGTSRFMPTFWEDCVALYCFKCNQIRQNQLPEQFFYTTCVELKNELSTWLIAFYNKYYKNSPEERIKDEIRRCCSLPEVIEAVNHPQPDHSGIHGFRDLVCSKNIDGIYELLQTQEKNNRLKRLLKTMLLKL